MGVHVHGQMVTCVILGNFVAVLYSIAGTYSVVGKKLMSYNTPITLVSKPLIAPSLN